MEEGIVYIGNNIFETLLAISSEEQSRGLMYIDAPIPNMSFVYARPNINKYWMANTKSPLDIIFCNNNKVSEICYGEPYSTKVIGSDKFSDLVIELPYGTATSLNIKVGQSAEIAKPTPQELQKILRAKFRF